MANSSIRVDMEGSLSTQGWITRAYGGDAFDKGDPLEPEKEALRRALEIFKKSLTKDPAKRGRADELLKASTWEGVLKAVLDAKKHYEDGVSKSKIRERLSAFSQWLKHYGDVIDVLVQHHPEYVSLAWGAMKLIFGAIVEHEHTFTTIVTALCDICESLPSMELKVALYPTHTMKNAVSMLYAHILRFLVRALDYYEESRLMRVVHTITRPVALRYQDLINLIRRDAEIVRNHAATSGQAELRATHNDITKLISQMERDTIEARAQRLELLVRMKTLENLVAQVQHNHLETRTALSDVQLTQALSMVAANCTIDHKSLFQSSLQMIDTRAAFRQKSKHNVAAFWNSSKLQQWSSAATSSTILVSSTFRQSLELRRCCTEIVKQLLKDRIAVFWVFMSTDRKYSLLETLRSLVYQALSLDFSKHTERSMSFQLSKYVGANFEDDYLNMLGDLLQHLKHVYILVNSEAMAQDTAAQCRACLQRLSRLLSDRGCQTVLKVIVTSCGSEVRDQDMTGDVVLDLTRAVGQAHQRRARKEAKRRGVNFSLHHFYHSY